MRRIIFLLLFFAMGAQAQYPIIQGPSVKVFFNKELRPWDGFGFNYVECAQTPDYSQFKQEYGGFSLLDDKEKAEIIDKIFGEQGLKVALVKMFCDPLHQAQRGGPYDHLTTTANMREFVRLGLAKTRERGANLSIITTLYGPPAYMTLQQKIRGRDLNPACQNDLADYLVSWVKFLRETENLPVDYVSLHNEGEDWERWPLDGRDANIGQGHDYNLYWNPQQVTEMVKLTRRKMDQAHLQNVGITPGETTNWFRFSYWGYADALADDPQALEALGLITSHGFFVGTYDNRWFGDHNCLGTQLIQNKKPSLHAWVTSTSWSHMDTKNIKEMHDNIYSARVNGIIPWAGIQRPSQWVGGDPNPGSAFTVHEDGSYTVRRGYYFYKQITRAGQPGMSVCRTLSTDSEIPVIAFRKNNTANTNAFVVTNTNSKNDKTVVIDVVGATGSSFKAYRTLEDESELYREIGTFKAVNGTIIYQAPKGSVTTFFEL